MEGYEGQGRRRLLGLFFPWIVTNLYNEKVLKALRLPPPKTWKDLLNPIYRGNIVFTLPYASVPNTRW